MATEKESKGKGQKVTSERTIGGDVRGLPSMVSSWAICRVVVCAILLQLSLLMFSVPASAKKPGYSVHPAASWRSFSVKGSRGYDVLVVQEGKAVRIEAFGPEGGSAAYQTQAVVKENMIRARFGSVGQIAMRFVPSSPLQESKEPQGDCHGKKSLVQRGTFRGTFEFNGELGFTTARANRVRGLSIRKFREVCRGATAALGPDQPVRPFLQVSRRQRSDEVHVLVYDSQSLSGLEAGLINSRPHLIIERWCWDFGNDVRINNDSAGNTVIEAGSPFEGGAQFQPNAEATSQWTGDLRCSFPGRGVVALAGLGFHAE